MVRGETAAAPSSTKKCIDSLSLLEIEEREAKAVKLIYTMCLAEKSVRSITEYLTKKGYRNRNGNIFSTKLIGDILKNRIYTGKLVWNRYYYDKSQRTAKGHRYVKNPLDKVIIANGKHEALITEDDFVKVQELLKVRRVEHKKKVSDYPLSGILYCARCNHKYQGLSSVSNHRTGVKKRWYRCAGPYRSFVKCKNKMVKAEEIEPKVAFILDRLLHSKSLKNSRWTTMTDTNSPSLEKISKIELGELKNRPQTNLKKQSKLTDAYLENLFSEEVFKAKNESLRQEEEELKKRIALQELREIEWERSTDYLERLEEFASSYDPNVKELDSKTQKQVLGLLFKNIKIAKKEIFSFDFFAPFNLFFSEVKQKWQLSQKQKLTKKIPLQSILKPMAGRWCKWRDIILGILKGLSDLEL